MAFAQLKRGDRIRFDNGDLGRIENVISPTLISVERYLTTGETHFATVPWHHFVVLDDSVKKQEPEQNLEPATKAELEKLFAGVVHFEVFEKRLRTLGLVVMRGKL